MRFLFDSAVVGVRPRMSAARKRRCGGRAVYCGKNERIRTGKNTRGGKYVRGKIRAAGGAAGRAEDASGKRVLIFTGKFGGGFTRRVRMRIGRNGRRKSPARGRGEKAGGKCSVPTKTVAGKVSRGQGESVRADRNGELRKNR